MPSSRDIPDSGIEKKNQVSRPHSWQVDSLALCHLGSPRPYVQNRNNNTLGSPQRDNIDKYIYETF